MNSNRNPCRSKNLLERSTRPSNEPKISFTIRPEFADVIINSFRFEFGDAILLYRHGPTRPLRTTWPQNSINDATRIIFIGSKSIKNINSSITTNGDWSLFKMLDLAALADFADRSACHVTFNNEEVRATLLLSVDNEQNPFCMRLLQNFYLPMEL